MKRLTVLLILFSLLSFSTAIAQGFEAQGTTVKHGDDSCTINIIMQIALENATDEQFNVIKNDLEKCFNAECQMPCLEGKGKGCKIKAAAVLKKWSELSAEDKPKFHHIKVVDHVGTSCSKRSTANSGVSGWGTWYFPEDSNAYCHETLHLAGLEDKYCDCTRTDDSLHNHSFRVYGHRCNPPPDPNGGVCCTDWQPNGQRVTFPCPECGSDIMATLTSGISCINYARIVMAAGISECPATCCEEKKHNPGVQETIHNAKIGLTLAAEVGAGIFKEKVASGVVRNIGPAISFAIGANKKINEIISIGTALKFAYDRLSASKETSKRPATGVTIDNDEHFAYKYASLYLDMYIYWYFMQKNMLIIGPQVGAIIAARNRYKATYTTEYNGYTTIQEYGSDNFSKITASKNVAVAVNVGLGREITIKGMSFTPYILYRQPITNVLSGGSRNALTQITIGMQWPFK